MDEDKEQVVAASEEDNVELTFRYLKSNFFRVIHADGVIGGVTSRGNIHISFYNERAALPDKGKVIIDRGTGKLLKPEQYQGAGGIIREIEADVMIDLPTAVQLSQWLNNHIKILHSIIQGTETESEDEGESNAEIKTGTQG